MHRSGGSDARKRQVVDKASRTGGDQKQWPSLPLVIFVNIPGPLGNHTASLACEGSMTAAQRKQLHRWRKLDFPSMFSHVALARTMNSPWEPRSSTILLDLLSRVYSVYTALTRQRMKWGGSVYLSI